MISLGSLALSFLRLGAIGFGGPLALIALMEQEFVREKKWIKKERFEATFLFCKMLPGPIAYQMALWTGHELRGKRGGLIAGVCFILPSASLLYLLGRFYSLFDTIKGAQLFLDGMKIGALLIIVQSIGSLFTPYRERFSSWLYAGWGIAGMVLFPRLEPLVILSGGFVSLFLSKSHKQKTTSLKLSSWSVLWALFFTHFKAGAFVFGTGLAIIPVLEREAVEVYRWLSRPEFLDALSFSQITPGPVTTMAAFIGYKAAGSWGSVAATVGMYLPGALMILLILPRARKKLEEKPFLFWFQWGAVPTVIGCLVASCGGLLKSVLIPGGGWVIFLVLGLIQWKWKLPAWGLIFLASLTPALKALVFS